MILEKFSQAPLILPKVEQINGGPVRLYETPGGYRYPSVTSVIGAMSDKSFLEVWKKNIGEKEAERATKRAGVRGTAVHLMCEKYVLNQDIDFSQEMPFNVHLFEQFRKALGKRMNEVKISEGYLFSHKLKVAGSVDLVANYDGTVSIIDFKTSGKNKRRDWIHNYFIQATLYAIMLYELTGIMCKQIVIIIAVEEEYEPQIFIEKTTDWMKPAIDMVQGFWKNNSLQDAGFVLV